MNYSLDERSQAVEILQQLKSDSHDFCLADLEKISHAVWDLDFVNTYEALFYNLEAKNSDICNWLIKNTGKRIVSLKAIRFILDLGYFRFFADHTEGDEDALRMTKNGPYFTAVINRLIEYAETDNEIPREIQEHALSILGMTTLHFDGYVREAALNAILDILKNPKFKINLQFSFLPFVLIRLNDWVPQVTQLAHNIVEYVLSDKKNDKCSLVYHLLMSVSFIEWLSVCKRRNLNPIREAIYDFLLSEDNRNHAFLFFTNKQLFGSMSATDKLILCNKFTPSLYKNPQWVDTLLKDPFPQVQSYLFKRDLTEKFQQKSDTRGSALKHVAKYILLDDEYPKRIRQLAQNKSSHARHLALKHILCFVPHNQQKNYIEIFRAALFENKAIIRKEAEKFFKEHSTHSDYKQDILREYRRSLSEQPSLGAFKATPGALIGLGKLGSEQDEPVLNEYMHNKNSALSSAAYMALDSISCLDNVSFSSGLASSDAQTRKACGKILKSKKRYDRIEWVIDKTYDEDTYTNIRVDCFALLNRICGFDKILYILKALNQKNATLKRRAWSYLASWHKKYIDANKSKQEIGKETLRSIWNALSLLREKNIRPPYDVTENKGKAITEAWRELPLIINKMFVERGLPEPDEQPIRFPDWYILSVKKQRKNIFYAHFNYSEDMCKKCACGSDEPLGLQLIDTAPWYISITYCRNNCTIIEIQTGDIIIDSDTAFALKMIGASDALTPLYHFDDLRKECKEESYFRISPKTTLPPFNQESKGYEKRGACPACGRGGYYKNEEQLLSINYDKIDSSYIDKPILRTAEYFGNSSIVEEPRDLESDEYCWEAIQHGFAESKNTYAHPLIVVNQYAANVLIEYCNPEDFELTPVEGHFQFNAKKDGSLITQEEFLKTQKMTERYKLVKKLWNAFDPIGVYKDAKDENWPDDEYHDYARATWNFMQLNAEFETIKDYVKSVCRMDMDISVPEEQIDDFVKELIAGYNK